MSDELREEDKVCVEVGVVELPEVVGSSHDPGDGDADLPGVWQLGVVELALTKPVHAI